MAKTAAVDVPDELKNLEAKAIERRDRYIVGACQGAKRIVPKVHKKRLRNQSLFTFLAPLWGELTTEQKAVWAQAAAFSSLSNWQLFISDNAARLRNDLELSEPPSDLWQVRAGHIVIEAPADEILLKQVHPQDYYVAQKVVGKPWKRELVKIEEQFSLPLELQIRYKSDLEPIGGGELEQGVVDFALSEYSVSAGDESDFVLQEQGAAGGPIRFYARVWTSYQGEDRYTDLVLDMEASSDWTLISDTLTSQRGILIGYTLYLEITGYTGELLFDNIRAIHGGTNWARDPRCDAIDQTFTKAFSVVPPFWIPESLPEGASYSSQYPPAL